MGNIMRKARGAQKRGARKTRTFDGENTVLQGSTHGPHVSKAEAPTFKMAFFMRASGASNAELINRMRTMGSIRKARVADVMTAVDRGLFVPSDEEPYFDVPQPIGYNATISAPHMHAHCLELLEDRLQPGARALDVGSGTGYLTACFGMMVNGKGGKAVGVEHIKELKESSKSNVRKSAAGRLLDKGVIELHTADGRKGWPAAAPYDVIHVGAAAPGTPKELLEQLKPGGRMVCPVGDALDQHLMVYDKSPTGDSVRERAATAVRYVPLIDEKSQRNGVPGLF